MKTTSITTTLVLVTSLAISAPALAGDGFYISGGINNTTQENNQSRNTGSNQPNVGASGGASGTVVDKDTGIGFVVGAGYKYRFSQDMFASVEAFYSTESAETTTLNNVRSNNIELNATYGADVRFGTDVTDKVAIYGLVGATAHDLDSNLSYTFAPPLDFVSGQVWGFTYGGGVGINLTEKLSTFGEFRLANDLNLDTPVDQGGIQTQEDLNYTTLRTGFRFSF